MSSISFWKTPTPRFCCAWRMGRRRRARLPRRQGVPVYTLEMDANGFVRIARRAAREDGRGARRRRHRAGAAHQRQHGAAQARAHPASQHHGVDGEYRRALTALTPKDVSLCVMPLFHVHGLVASTLSTLLSGGTVVVPEQVQSAFVLAHRARFRRDLVFGGAHHPPPAAFARGNEPPAGREGLRFIRSCSAALPPEMMAKMEERVRRAGARSLRHDGSVASDELESAAAARRASRARWDREPASRSASWMTPAIMLAAGERGEVVIQGPNVVSGYENNPEANAKSFTNGWFRTGDQGFLDADGYLTLTGRIKELINRGGEKIAPREIDEVLLAHPAVAEAVAFGVPHATWGEEVDAAVVLERAGDAKRRSWPSARSGWPTSRCPKKLFIVETIPRTATGKIQRGAVGKALAEQGMKFLIAGAGAIGGYIGARMARAGAGRDALRARSASAGDAGARAARVSADGDFEVHPHVIGDLKEAGPMDVIFLGVKAHGLTQLAPQVQPLIGENTTVVSTQNGIPWWYFQAHAGELTGLHLERVDPGGVIAASIPARAWSARSCISPPILSSRA